MAKEKEKETDTKQLVLGRMAEKFARGDQAKSLKVKVGGLRTLRKNLTLLCLNLIC